MDKEIRIDNLKWYSPFYLNKPISNNIELLKSRGVYLWVYENKKYKRIIYVGSAWSQKGFIKRVKEEISDILTGGAFIFKIGEDTNPYDLLSKNEKDLDNDFYYPKRGSLEKEYNWIKDYAYDYLSKLRYWVCPLPEIELISMQKLCQYLETQIQAVLKNRYSINYINNKLNLSWVGKLDKIYDSNIKYYHYNFATVPDIDDKSIFRNLNIQALQSIENLKSK